MSDSPALNIVIAGHVDHGKSTLIGRLLYDSKTLPESKMTQIERVIQEYKKKFEFAYFLDGLEEEVKEEKTIDTTQAVFRSEKNTYNIIDVPGHTEFLKNMLTGASYGHLAVVVVSVSEGMEEQTRRHLFILQFLGIRRLVICINKMDKVKFKQEPFIKLKDEVRVFLKELGFDIEEIPFVPISAFKGDNLYKKSRRLGWYKGKCLTDILDEISIEEKKGFPLRFSVQDIYEVDQDKVVVGRVESGTLKRKDKIIFEPGGNERKVEKIIEYQKTRMSAGDGECAGLVLDDITGIKRGNVAGLTDNPPRAYKEIKGEVIPLLAKLKLGEDIVVKAGTAKTRMRIKNILRKIDSESLKELDDQSMIDINQVAKCELELLEPVVFEKYSQLPSLGRFILEDNHKNIGAGIIIDE